MIAQFHMVVNSVMSQRRQAIGGSTFFDGKRDVYAVAGYPEELSFTQLKARYRRQSIARRLVHIKPADTWRKKPRVLDGNEREGASENTPFAKAWSELVRMPYDPALVGTERKSAWHYLKRADRMCGYGEYSAIVLGLDDGGKLEDPLKLGGAQKLLYLNAYDQGEAEIQESDLVKDPKNPRFGLPERYSICMSKNAANVPVHWTRVIHVCDNQESSEVYGIPLLSFVFNDLVDLEKVMASAGESAWRTTTKKIILTTEDGFAVDEAEVPSELVEDMLHNLRDVVELSGYKVQVIEGSITDPGAAAATYIQSIAAGGDVPQRRLVGSERGELASSQDEATWYDVIEDRRSDLAEPLIISLLHRLIFAGVLPPPTTGIFLDWPALDEPTNSEKVQMATGYAEALAKVAAPGVERVVDLTKFIRTFIKELPNDAVPDEIEALDQEQQQFQVVDGEQDGTPALQRRQQRLLNGGGGPARGQNGTQR